MTYHIRPPIHNEADWRAFSSDRVIKGEAFMQYAERGIRLSYEFLQRSDLSVMSLVVLDVSNAFTAGKVCVGYRLEAFDDQAIEKLDSYLADVNYDMSAFVDWCASLNVDYDAYGEKFVNGDPKITICKRESKGIATFSPLALNHLKPMKDIPSKWTMPHVRRLLAAGQYSYCGTALRLTSDYAHDANTNFGEGQCSGEDFLRTLTESPSGWAVSPSDGGANDGDQLAVWCHTFEKRVITIDLSASRRDLDKAGDAQQSTDQAPVVAHDPSMQKPAGVLMH